MALAAVSGALLGMAYPPVGAWWLAWVALVPLLAAAARSSARGAFACGWIAGLVWFGVILDWLRLFGEPPFNIVLWLLAVGIEAAFVGLFSLLVRALLAGPAGGVFLVGVPALWTFCEWLRCTGPWGFPWGVLGETQANQTALIQFAAITGGWGVTFLVALVNGYLAGLLRRNPSPELTSPPAPPRNGEGCLVSSGPASDPGSPSPLRGGGWGERLIPGQGSPFARWGILVALLLVAALAYGEAALRAPAAHGPLVRVAVVQGNIERDDGWPVERPGGVVGTYGELTRQALERRPALVVWPETVVPGDVQRDTSLLVALATLARQGNCHLLVGTPHADERGGLKNSAVLVGPEGRLAGSYDKVHLVPFGEYIPFRQWMPFLDRFPSVTDQTPGEGFRPLAAGPTRVGAMICFESAFPAISREMVRQGAGLLAVLTSDASFGRTSAAEHHAAKAIFRAIETRRWVIQAATTGISLAVDPRGRVRERIGLFRSGVLVADAVAGGPTTPYVRFGDWLVALCGLVAVGLALRRRPVRLAAGLVACLVLAAGCGDPTLIH
jgi:apolipoprotein N-acyltransferase